MCVCVCRNSYVVPTNLFQGIKAVNPMFRGYSQQVFTIITILPYIMAYIIVQKFEFYLARIH